MFLKSHFSLRYGLVAPEELVSWSKEAGYEYVALCDINSTSSTLSYVREAQKTGTRPVIGADIRNGIEQCYLLIAKNNRGLHELNRFLSQHLHDETVFPETPPHLGNCFTIYPWGKEPGKLRENEWIGIQSSQLNQLTIKKSKVAYQRMLCMEFMTFRNKKDFNAHRLLRAIDNNILLSRLSTDQQASEEEKLIPLNELQERFQDFPELIERTTELLSHCHIHFGFGDDATPQNLATYTGSKEEDLELLKELCAEGLDYRYPITTDEIIARIEKEIEIIAEKDYLSYFLITWDFTSYARSKGYFYVGRGSGANSIVAYLLRITDVDPLELDLYFERFINLYRKNPPDFDIDFSWRDRDDVTQYIFDRYPNAALLCTYNTFQYSAAVRELGKVFGLPKSEIDILSKGKFQFEKLDQVSQLVIKYSKYIHGLPSHLSVHAGGIIISEKPISWYSGTFMPPKGYPTTQFSMLEAEDVGLYKFDILSQRGLGKIREAVDIIAYNQPENPSHDIHDIRYFKEDEKVKDLLRNAKAMGCFYVESPAMRMLLVKLQVDTYLGLVAASSIIRPGVAQSGMMREYILRHRYPEKRKEAHPILQEIMPETYGVMVYQEDVIKVAHHFADLSLAEADVLRRGMSGKFRSREEFNKVKETFFNNCYRKGFEHQVVADIWRQIESFAGYAFSKGHSASYAVESYQSLYLKAHYPLEYMTACINNFGGYYRTEVYVHEARTWGAIILAPSINEGDYVCTLKGKELILGFILVNGIEGKLIVKIIEERRKNGVFKNFDDLMKRCIIPLEQLSLIIRIGGLRDFPESRKELLWKAHLFHNKVKDKQHVPVLFETERRNFSIPQLTEQELELAFEQMELLGFPLCNPFLLLAQKTTPNCAARSIHQHHGKKILTYGYLIALKRSRTNKGEDMFFGTFIDQHGDLIDTVHFPEFARKYPFYGKGIYELHGVVTEEFGYHTVEVGMMIKLAFMEDIRFSENAEIS
jgi:DNA-directed DNA polymerase III PolC